MFSEGRGSAAPSGRPGYAALPAEVQPTTEGCRTAANDGWPTQAWFWLEWDRAPAAEARMFFAATARVKPSPAEGGRQHRRNAVLNVWGRGSAPPMHGAKPRAHTSIASARRGWPTQARFWLEWERSHVTDIRSADALDCLHALGTDTLSAEWSEGRVEIESEGTPRKREWAAGTLCSTMKLPHSSQNRA